ncbi:hypothetical protein [Streptomyces sp. NPDC127040]|uniref:hypothetical protein n=1 Tax=Streptomyces sp. NPDC127040 TaxID=3347116 RepID=UPI00366266C2
MLALILLFAIAYCCAKAIDDGLSSITDGHKKRRAKASKKKGKKTGALLAASVATAVTAAGAFGKGFVRGWKREWPKARKRAAARWDRDETSPAQPEAPAESTPEAPAPSKAPAAPVLTLIKSDDTDTTGGNPMALAAIQEITGVNTLKAAVARFASEASIGAEEAGALAQRATDQLTAIEAAIEQASALEFDEDGGTLAELGALRDQYLAALNSAQAHQQAAVDAAAIASQSSKNIHDRHGHIQEAVAAAGGRMASKQAYTNDV